MRVNRDIAIFVYDASEEEFTRTVIAEAMMFGEPKEQKSGTENTPYLRTISWNVSAPSGEQLNVTAYHMKDRWTGGTA